MIHLHCIIRFNKHSKNQKINVSVLSLSVQNVLLSCSNIQIWRDGSNCNTKKVIPGAKFNTELNKHSKICSTTIYQMSNYVDFGWKSSPLYCMPSKRFVAVQFSKRYAFMLERIWQEINNSLLSFLSFVSWNDVIFSNQSFVVVYSFIDILTMLRDDSTWFTFITFLLPLLTNQDKKDNFAGKIMSISSPKQYLID